MASGSSDNPLLCDGCENTVLSFTVLSEDQEKLTRFLYEHGVLQRTKVCPTCGGSMTLNEEKHAFNCWNRIESVNSSKKKVKIQCKKYVSQYKNTWFESHNLSQQTICRFVAIWMRTLNPAITEVGIKMAARLNFSKFLKGTKKFITPTIPYLNRAYIRNDVSIHSFCLSMYKENVPTVTSYGAQDILLSKIRSATDTWDILEAVNQHHSIMNNNHALQGLRSIFILQKSQSGCMSNGEVVNSPQFRLLANTLRSQIRHLDVNELIDSLKYLGYLGVPVTTKIMQTVLHLLSKHINELTLQQITFLDFLMKDFKNTPLVKALNIALPIVFEAHLLTMCDFKNVNQLTDLLIFVSRRPVHDKCCRIIIDALTEQRNNIDLKIAKSIIRSYCELKRENVKDELLLHHSLDVITDSVDNLPFYELEGILTRMLSKHIYGYDHFYHEEFLNACGKYISNKNCNIEQGTWILRKLHRFNHVSLPLLDYLAEKVSKEPWTLEQAQAGVLISFIFGLAHADYKPQNWDRIKDLVIKCAEMHQDRQELPWIKFILDMCVMDCWSRPLIEKVFNEEFLKKYLSREYNTLDKLQLLALHQCVSTLAPWTDGPSVPSKFLESAIEINGTHHTNFPLLPALVHGLGDHSYVMNGVYTKFGHFIDHLIVMRKGGYPVAVNLSGNDQFTPNSKRKYVENLDLPAETIKVAVLFLTPSMSSINNERIRGTVRLHVNTIEALGISVVPVLQTVWDTIMDSEKIPYLMQGIQLKANVVQPTPIIVPV